MALRFAIFLIFELIIDLNSVVAQEVFPWEIKCVAAAVEKLQGKSESCAASTQVLNPKCTDLTDDLCSSLWSDKNKGRLVVSDGVINVGLSQKSEMAFSRIEDFKAIIDGVVNLPPDLKEKFTPLVDELKALLAKESDTKSWYRSISDLSYRWGQVAADAATERTEQLYPELKKVKEKDLSIEQKALYQKDVYDVRSQILEAKYLQHPNWKRVQRVFDQAQSDILLLISEMKIPAEEKSAMIKQIKTIKVSLPYTDPTKLGAGEDCGSTEMNAFYDNEHNTLTVCAGYFNSMQSDSAIYGTVAHEIGHAIDPNSRALQHYRKNSPFFTSTQKLAGAKGPALSCEDWKKSVTKVKKIEPLSKPKTFDSMSTLYNCLQSKSKLEAYTKDAIRRAAEKSITNSFGEFSSANGFLLLAQPTFTKSGKKIENEFFMRPDRYIASQENNVFVTTGIRDAQLAEIFVQSLSCQEMEITGKKVTYLSANKNERSKLFEMAIKEAKDFTLGHKIDWYSYCGQNCSELVSEKLAVNAQEDFADWISFNSLSRFLERKSDLRERRESSALASVDLCEMPGAKKEAPDLAAIEKKHSSESHPDTRLRRISTFNKSVAQLVKCEVNKADQGSSSCVP